MSGELPGTNINPRDSEKLYRYFIEGTHDLVQRVNPNGEIVFVNKSWEQTLGYTEADRITLNLFDIIHPDSRQLCREIFNKILEGESIESVEVVFIKKDGSTVMLEGNIFPFIIEGKVIATQSFFHDITARKKADSEKFTFLEELKKSEKKYRALVERVSDGFVSLDNNWCFTYMNKKAGEISAIDPEKIIGKNIWQEFPQWMDTLFYKAFHEAKATQRHVFLEEYHPGNDTWIENNFYPAAEGVSVFFKNITKKKKISEALINSEEKYRTLVEQASDAIFIADETGRLITVNTSACKLTGLTEKELLQMNYRDFALFEDIQKNPFHFEELRAGKTVTTERPMKGKMGEIIYVEITAKILSDGRLLAFVRDISKRKKAEAELMNRELLFRSLTSNAPVAIFQTNTNGECTYVNEEWMKYAGMKFDEAMGYGWYNTIHPEDKERVLAEWQSSISSGSEFGSEFRFRDKKGKTTWLSAKAVALIDSNKKTYGYIGMAKDISERKRSEEEKTRLLSILDESTNGIYVFNKDDFFFKYVNKGAIINQGYSLKEMTLMTPADIKPEFTLATFKELVAPLINKEIDKLVFETIHERKDKTTYPVEVHLQLVVSGNDTVFLAIIQDITERKKAEEKIIQSKNLYRHLFENLLHGFAYFKVIVKDDKVDDLVYLSVNNEYEKILGLKNIAGKKISELIPDGLDADPTYKERLTQVALHGEKLKFETFLNPLNKWLSISLYCVEKEYGVLLVEDITERKTAEEKISTLNNELEQRVKERTAELENANNELEEINDLFVGREARIIELKEELEALKKKAGL